MPKLVKEEQVVLPDFQEVLDNIEAIETVTEIPRLLKAWGAIKRESLRRKAEWDITETARKFIEAHMKKTLIIPDDAMESEKIEVKDIGSVKVILMPALVVKDWSGLMAWAVKTNWTEIIQKRQGQRAVVALEQALIDDVDLKLPEDLATFNSFKQLSITKSRNLK